MHRRDCEGSSAQFGYVALLLLTCTVVDVAVASGKLHVQFLDYSSGGRTASGNVCDPPHPVTGQPDPCDPQFKLKVERKVTGREMILFYQQADVYNNQDTVHFIKKIGERQNPIIISLNYDDNDGKVLLEISVTDIDGAHGSDELMSQFADILAASGKDVKKIELRSSTNQTLSLRYWFSCNANYYGNLCNKYCIDSNNNSFGHYGCDLQGDKMCRFGWIDASTDCKKPHPCRTCVCANGGICVPQGDSGYRCQCPTGYHGANCQSCSLEADQCSTGLPGTAAAGSCDLQVNEQPSADGAIIAISVAALVGAIVAAMAFGIIGTGLLCCCFRRRSRGQPAHSAAAL